MYCARAVEAAIQKPTIPGNDIAVYVVPAFLDDFPQYPQNNCPGNVMSTPQVGHLVIRTLPQYEQNLRSGSSAIYTPNRSFGQIALGSWRSVDSLSGRVGRFFSSKGFPSNVENHFSLSQYPDFPSLYLISFKKPGLYCWIPRSMRFTRSLFHPNSFANSV